VSASAWQAYTLFTESSKAVDFITLNCNSTQYDQILKREVWLQLFHKAAKLLCEEGLTKG
jgi:hypothetical protein